MSKDSLYIGQIVSNFNIEARVVAFHEVTGDPVLESYDGMRWLADAAKCSFITTQSAVLDWHRFVTFQL